MKCDVLGQKRKKWGGAKNFPFVVRGGERLFQGGTEKRGREGGLPKSLTWISRPEEKGKNADTPLLRKRKGE